MLALAVLLAAAAFGPPNDRAGAANVIANVNHHREDEEVAPLREDRTLDGIALVRADDMDVRGYFNHVDPEGRTAFVDLLKDDKYPFTAAAENIALSPTVAEAEEGLWLSTGHRENILDPRYRRIGVAVVHGENGKIYVVEIFAG